MTIVRGVSGALGFLATSLLVLGFFIDRTQAIYSYLFAFIFVWTLVVGALFLLMIEHASQATWFVPIRRQCERIVSTLPFLALLVVPILVFAKDLYPWTHWHSLPELQREHVERKLAWLNLPFFAIRSLVYAALFSLFGELLRRWSAEQDSAENAQQAQRSRERMVKLSVGGLVLLSFVLTFASWDWVMTLEPAWYSNLYGVYLFAGGVLSALGLMGIIAVFAKGGGALPKAVSHPHYHALGRLQLTFVIFWAYIGWCHVLQQWIGNLPLELLWYVNRWYHGWQWEGLSLVLLHFALPFLFLLPRATKENPKTFTAISVWLVIIHALDVHYLVLPALHPRSYTLHWLDLTALVAVTSLTLWFGSLRGRHLAAIPQKDPLLQRGLAYESPL